MITLFKKLHFCFGMVFFTLCSASTVVNLDSFGVDRSVLSAVEHEMNSFEGSGRADQFKPHYDNIKRYIQVNSDNQTLEKTEELLNIIHKARMSISDENGRSLMWGCVRTICNGHSIYSKKFRTHNESVRKKVKIYEELLEKKEIDQNSIKLFDAIAHGNRILCCLYGSSFIASASAPIYCQFSCPYSFISYLVGAYCVYNTVKTYGSIAYSIPIFYKHEDDSVLTHCDNQKYVECERSTRSLIDALTILHTNVLHFKLQNPMQ